MRNETNLLLFRVMKTKKSSCIFMYVAVVDVFCVLFAYGYSYLYIVLFSSKVIDDHPDS